LVLGIVITVDDKHWIRQKWYLWQFSAWLKTMAMTVSKIPIKVFSHSGTVTPTFSFTTHSIVDNFSDRNWPVVGPKLPSPWSDGSSCCNHVKPNRPFEQLNNNETASSTMVIIVCVIDMIILTVGCCLVTKTALAMVAVLLLSFSC
jgi:hypothetical protein